MTYRRHNSTPTPTMTQPYTVVTLRPHSVNHKTVPNMHRRSWLDKHVFSHVAFLPSIYVALIRDPPFLEVAVLVTDVLILSVYYPRLHEPHGTGLARTEFFFSFLLYVYGIAQILYTDIEEHPIVFLLSILMLFVVSITYVTGCLWSSRHWDRTHYIGMHIIPGLWCYLVARYNDPITEF